MAPTSQNNIFSTAAFVLFGQILRFVQKAEARVLPKTRRRTHVTPVLGLFHGLPVTLRVDLKNDVINGLAPSYCSDCLSEFAPNCALRSFTAGVLSVPKMTYRKCGEAAFCSYAPKLWSELPSQTRQATSAYFYDLAFN